jgi:hypothetical protein
MPSQHSRPTLKIFIITIFVIAVVLGAFALSGAAVVENLRFAKAIDQILEPIGLMRSIIEQQPTFSENPGADIWAELARLRRIPSATGHVNPWGSDPMSLTTAQTMSSTTGHVNPWGSDVHVFAVTNAAIRVESDFPTHDCRRMALYFLNNAPAFELLAIEAQPFEQVLWTPIYPMPTNALRDSVVDVACGNAPAARLALVFKLIVPRYNFHNYPLKDW